uniref:Uncharacterized protein n=1 Tax=Glossina austeni TaxID=7395 RepID=A0A1A9V0U4_GLOAU
MSALSEPATSRPQGKQRHQAPNRDPHLAKAAPIAIHATSHANPTSKQAASVQKIMPIPSFHPCSGSGQRRIDTTSEDMGLHVEENLISATVIIADRRVTATVDTGATTSFVAAALAREIEKTCRRDPYRMKVGVALVMIDANANDFEMVITIVVDVVHGSERLPLRWGRIAAVSLETNTEIRDTGELSVFISYCSSRKET